MWYKLAKQLELPEMNVAQNPVELKTDKESQPKQELFETQKEPRSLFFNEWAQGYKVPEQPVYHGTTREFDQFDLSKGYVTNLFGPGFYFTSDENDISDVRTPFLKPATFNTVPKSLPFAVIYDILLLGIFIYKYIHKYIRIY